MFYREAGQFKTSYAADSAKFPIRQDLVAIWIYLAIGFLVIPVFGDKYFIEVIMIPFLVLALAAIGLNILVGYTGQISLGTGGFMGVGAYSCYKMATYFPDMNIIVLILLSGFFAAIVGVIFGLPSLRIKGFYLVVTTLAAQFFLEWAFIRIPWLYNYNDTGAINEITRESFGYIITGAQSDYTVKYLVVLSIVVGMTWIASNLISGRIGRSWMMIRDMDIAAELMGVRPLYAKLSAFAVSSFYCGVAGSMMVFFWQGSAEVEIFDYNRSFQILFMVILGGLGSLLGSFLGAAIIFILPIIIRAAPDYGIPIQAATADHISLIIIGVLIVVFLILEPLGLARLWGIIKQKLRVWPFPY
ncbi:MAG: branched-chain amino acid ABC transporter permease [Rhizobiaceae bacterium]|jgi:branched-chain amino acid transport system permease protein|nr:branched-chain amino acid ABC transporter permease [Rhizobiaceae bacterium]